MGLPRGQINGRLKAGWSMEDAILTPKALVLAQEYADAVATHRLETLYGSRRSYTLEKARERDEAFTALDAELRRLHAENEALKAAQYECGFGAGCCYQAAKSEADEALLRQALEALEVLAMNYAIGAQHWPKAYAAIAALRERLGETK